MQRLKRSTLFYYSLADMPIMMSIFPVAVFIPKFYAADMGVSLGLIALILFTQRWFDVITDPLMGYISDRTRSRWGQRRPWIVASTPILMLAIYMLFLPPEGAGGVHLFVWMMVLSIGITMMLIPYYAWGAEITPDYNERSRVTGWRAQAGVVGSFSAQFIPAMIGILFFVDGRVPTATVLVIVGTTMLVLMPICVFLTIAKTPVTNTSMRSQIPLLQGLKVMWQNKAFLRLISAYGIGSLGLSITTPLYAFYIAYVLKAEGLEIYMLSFFYITNLLAVPVWVKLSTHIGKHKAYLLSLTLIACAHPFYMLLGAGDFWWMLPITIVTGFAAGGFSQSLPNSMKADVIDLDVLATGENRAALFFSAWSFIFKAAAAFGIVIATGGLQQMGFDPTAEIHTEDDLFPVRFLFSTFPSIFYLGAAALLWKWPITEERHAEIRAQLEGVRSSSN